MTGTYLLRIPAIRGACPEFLSASLTGGIATHHLHTEYQFATPADRSGVSLGGLRRIAVQPGEVIVVPPCTVHSEASVPGAEVAWHILHLPRVTLRRLARDGTYETARNPSGSPLYHDPTLAAMLADLVTAAAGNSLGSEDFLRRTRHWVEELVQRHGYPDSPVGHRASIDRARVYLLHEPTRALSLDEVARQAGTTPRHLARSFGPAVGLSLQRTRIPPTGKRFTIGMATIGHWVADRMAHEWIFWDSGDVMKQVGLAKQLETNLPIRGLPAE